MRPIVVHLDMVKVARILERRVRPVELPHPAVDIWVPIANGTQVALEVADIDGIEANLIYSRV